jgi:hypothetical protein
MFKNPTLKLSLLIALLIFISLACARSGESAKPKATLAPIAIGSDLSQVDLCCAIPKEDMEVVMERKLASQPERFTYYDTPGTSGCTYDAGKDASGNAYFGYVALTSGSVYDEQPLYKNVDVSGIGAAAYFYNGPDARQLWVKVNDTLALVVAFGDSPNEERAKVIARLVLDAIQ